MDGRVAVPDIKCCAGDPLAREGFMKCFLRDDLGPRDIDQKGRGLMSCISRSQIRLRVAGDNESVMAR